MNGKLRNRVFAIIMSILMVCQFMPGMSMISYANDDATATEVASNAAENDDTNDSSTDDADENALVKNEAKASESSNEAANNEVSHDLADHIKTLEIIGNPESVNDGDKVTVKFGWLIEGEVHGGSDSFTYQLPLNFKLNSASTGKITKGEGGEAIGTFRVDTNGLVTITYNKDYNTDQQTTINYMEITGEAEYGSDENGHEIKFTWNGGSKTVKVVNPGDFTITKAATRKFANNQLSHNYTIDYTVKIASELGTNDVFTITDKVIKTAGTGFDGDKFELDPSSFKLVDKDNKEIPISPVITDGKIFTINNVPALGAGGGYTLTYTLNVALQENSNGNDTSFVNVARATSGDITHSATKTMTTGWILKKYFVSYYNSLRMMRWYTHVRTAGTNLAGYTFTDTASAGNIYYDKNDTSGRSISLEAYDANGSKISITQPEFTVNGGTFSFTFPDVPNANYFYIKYYTTVDGEVGDKVEVKNTSTMTSKTGETWSYTNKGTGTIQGETTVNKEGLGSEEPRDGYVPFKWKSTITYDNVTKSTYEFVDVIASAQMKYDDGKWNTWSYPNDHYAIISDLMSGKLTVYIDDEGTERTLTEEEILNNVNIYFYSATSQSNTYAVAATDNNTHIKSFKIAVKNFKVKKIEYEYNTRFSLSHYANGTTWRMKNTLTAENISKDAYTEYNNDTLSEPGVEKQIRTTATSTVWSDSPLTFNYDTQEGELMYRILVTLEEGQTEFEVVDQLPEGFKLVQTSDKAPRVGAYNSTTNSSGYGWETNQNVTIDYSESTNQLKVSVKNIGTSLPLKDKNTVVIRYRVAVDEDFEKLDGAVVNSTSSGHSVSKEFTNTATLGNKSDSHTVKVSKSENVVSKEGEQVTNDGAYTRTVHYTLDINPNALDLLEGGDELTLTDTMSSKTMNFKLEPTSIKLYDAETGEEVEPISLNIEQPEEGETTTQKFTMKVSDATAYRLEYDYTISKRDASNAATEGTVSNSIELEGKVVDKSDVETQGINVKATSNHAGVQFVKVDSANNAKFLTAKFDLEKYNAETGKYELIENVTIGGENGLTFDYYSNKCKLDGNTLYRLVETDAPDGYQLDETPFYFIILGNVQDVRSGEIDATNLVIATEDDAKAAAGAPSGIEINMLEPNTGSYFELGNARTPASGKVKLEASKALDGRALNNEEFSFTVKEGNTVVATGKNDANGKVEFSEITYTIDDLGEHNYIVTEDSGNRGGVTYDDSSFEVKVTVEDDGTATLVTTVEYPTNGVTFANKYDVTGTEIELTATKTLTGRDLNAGEFSFTIKEGDTVVAIAENDADGNIKFEAISYTEAGTHNYTITEEAGNLGGVTYDKNSFDVTVTVVDNGDGTLTASAEYPAGGATFVNEYETTDTEIELAASKTLVGRDLSEGEFSFTIKEGDTVVAAAKNDADGNIMFPAISYSEAGIHNYTITEDAGNLGGITYDDSSFNVTVTVVDNGDGTLSASAEYPATGVVFTNEYGVDPQSIILEANKEISGRKLNDGEFSFTVKEGDNVVATGNNDAEGKIEFSAIEYAEAGVHNYTITEDAGNLGGVTYDDSSFNVTVTVVDNGDGTLTSEATYPEDGVKFSNEYDTDPVSIILEASKVLTGRDLNDGEFSFTVKEGDNVVASGKNDAEGKIEFSAIEYKLENVGTHNLVITEDAGDKGGVEYSNETYNITVTVSDNGDGTLSAVATMPEGGIVFSNSYKAAETYVTLGAKKNYTGAKLKNGQFDFELIDENGDVVEIVQNDAEGNISFETLRFDEAGEYIYTVSEIKGDEKGVTYDESVYTITITVTDDLEGKLVANVDTEGRSVEFNNKFTPSKSTTPKTGDNNRVIGWTGLMLVSVITVIAILFRRKKNPVK